MSDIKQNNTVSKSEAMRALTQFYNSTKDHFGKVIALKKHLFLSDVSVEVINETKAAITYTSTIGTKGTNPFTENDDWYWGGGFGKCVNPVDLTGHSSDAAQEISKKLQLVFKPIGITYGLYTNIETRYFDYTDNYLNSSGVNLYYKVNGSIDYYPCIDDNYMNFYYNGAVSAINNPHYYDMPPAGKTRLSVTQVAWGVYDNVQNNQKKFHQTWVKYGLHIPLYDGPSKLEDFVID